QGQSLVQCLGQRLVDDIAGAGENDIAYVQDRQQRSDSAGKVGRDLLVQLVFRLSLGERLPDGRQRNAGFQAADIPAAAFGGVLGVQSHMSQLGGGDPGSSNHGVMGDDTATHATAQAQQDHMAAALAESVLGENCAVRVIEYM